MVSVSRRALTSDLFVAFVLYCNHFSKEKKGTEGRKEGKGKRKGRNGRKRGEERRGEERERNKGLLHFPFSFFFFSPSIFTIILLHFAPLDSLQGHSVRRSHSAPKSFRTLQFQCSDQGQEHRDFEGSCFPSNHQESK